MKIKLAFCSLAMLAIVLVIPGSYNELLAQRRQIQIGGPDGVVIGGGSGIRIGGANGVQFGTGRGARFGPPGQGVQLGGGRGLRIGSFLLGGSSPPETRMAYPNNAITPPVVYQPRTLMLPASAKEPFDYRLNGTPYRLKPGREIHLQGNQRWTVRFSPGNQQPERSVSMEQPGRYVFRKSDQGWDLVHEALVPDTSNATRPLVPQSAPITVDKARNRIKKQPELVAPLTTKSGQQSEPIPRPAAAQGEPERLRSVLEQPTTKKKN